MSTGKLYSGLFENQNAITTDSLQEKVIGFLGDTDIDMAAFDDCVDNKKTLPHVTVQMAEGGSVGVQGAGFIIKGRPADQRRQRFESFENVLDEALASSE